MTFLAKSLRTTSSPAGFKSVFNVKSILFCCFKSEEVDSYSEAVVIETEIGSNEIQKEIKNEEEKEGQQEKGICIASESKKEEINQATEEVTDEYLNGNRSNIANVGIVPVNPESKVEVERRCEDDETQFEKRPLLETKGKEEEVMFLDEEEVDEDQDLPEVCKGAILEEGNHEEIYEEHPKDQNHNEGTISHGRDTDNLSEPESNVVVMRDKKSQIRTGDLRLKIGLSSDKTSLIITIFECHDFARPSSSTSSIREHLNVDVPPVLAYSMHVVVMQSKKQRFKTKMRQGPDPYFDETIKISRINPVEIRQWCLRFRLYGSLRNSMKVIIGEGFLPLSRIDIDDRIQCDIALMKHDPNISEASMNTLISTGQSRIESSNSLISIDRCSSNFLESGALPELMVGLAINVNTGRLTVEIKRGLNFPKLKDNKSPDTFIKVILVDSKGLEMFASKTTVKKASCNPEFEETFNFQVFMFQVDEITVTILGVQKLKLGRKFIFGTITIGNKATDEEGIIHWKDLILSKANEQIIKWHIFDLTMN